MRIGEVQWQGNVARRQLSWMSETFDLELELLQGRATLSDDSVIVAAMFSAMARQENLKLDNGEVDLKLGDHLPQLQSAYQAWFPEKLYRTEVEVPLRQVTKKRGERVAQFFTGGVDSMHSLGQHPEVTDLVYVLGFDIPLEEVGLSVRVVEVLEEFAREQGKRLLVYRTNLRTFTDKHVSWGAIASGAALAFVGHNLPGEIGRVIIPSSFHYRDAFPWGSHPATDPLWSSQALVFEHDGCEVTRFEKLAEVAKNQQFLARLRVCWQNLGGAYNCGRCEKCLRTLAGLEILGVFPEAVNFETPLDWKKISRIKLKIEAQQKFYLELKSAADSRGGCPEASRVLGKMLRGYQRRKVRKKLTEFAGRLFVFGANK